MLKMLEWHVCRTKLARKSFFGARIFSRKMLRKFPRNFWAFYVVGPKKGPAKFPSNFPPNFPSQKIKTNSPTSFCRSARRRKCGWLALMWQALGDLHFGADTMRLKRGQRQRVIFHTPVVSSSTPTTHRVVRVRVQSCPPRGVRTRHWPNPNQRRCTQRSDLFWTSVLN